jgi:alpha-tubulin suppressor-like RCC1 family protein
VVVTHGQPNGDQSPDCSEAGADTLVKRLQRLVARSWLRGVDSLWSNATPVVFCRAVWGTLSPSSFIQPEVRVTRVLTFLPLCLVLSPVMGKAEEPGCAPEAAPCKGPGGVSCVKALSAGKLHTCALHSDGTASCWGNGASGELGNDKVLSNTAPQKVAGLSCATHLAAGVGTSLAVLADGSVRIWGAIGEGHVAKVATEPSKKRFFNPEALGNIEQVVTGYGNCALKKDGTVWCWSSGEGKVRQIAGLAGVKKLTAGELHYCALLSGGAVQCWGKNGYGQLGDGTTVDRTEPAAVPGITGAKDVAAGSGHSCAVMADGSVQCWGNHSFGQLGDGKGGTAEKRLTPAPVTGLKNATAVALGGLYSCALLADGTVRCWGYNSQGALGVGTYTHHKVPTPVTGVKGVVQVVASATSQIESHTCALTKTHEVFCWGYNKYGEVGDRSSNNRRNAPVPVTW